jgi:hypothetical protein
MEAAPTTMSAATRSAIVQAEVPGPHANVAFGSILFSNSGSGVKLSTVILAGPTVLSAVGACPPHDGVRRRWRINVESAVTLSGARKESNDLAIATVPAGTTFSRRVAGIL